MSKTSSLEFLRELENLEKHPEGWTNGLTVLKSHVPKLGSEAIPLFLAHVTEKREISLCSMECFMSLLEVLARVHGRSIAPHVDVIMAIVTRTLSLRAGSIALHQACSKVVLAIARFGIDGSTLDIEKKRIICLLCKPLSDYLMSKEEAAASGAALCLKALVESENWRSCPSEMVNEVCLKVAVALEEKQTQTCSHLSLVMALSKSNPLTADAYARSLIRSGLQILATDVKEIDSQRPLLAIQMINVLMRFVDSRSLTSELAVVIDVLEKCHNDCMPFVKDAAIEALRTAKAIFTPKAARHTIYSSPCTGSNFEMRNDGTNSLMFEEHGNTRGNSYPEFCSPESDSVDSSLDYNTRFGSPLSLGQLSQKCECVNRRRFWTAETALKDDFFMIPSYKIGDLTIHSEWYNNGEINDSYNKHSEHSCNVDQPGAACVLKKDATVSPQELHHSSCSSDNLKAKVVDREGCKLSKCNSLCDDFHAGATGAFLTEDCLYNSIFDTREKNNSGSTEKLKNDWLIQDAQHAIDATEVVTCASNARQDDDGKALSGASHEDNAVPSHSKEKGKCEKFPLRYICCLLVVVLAIVLIPWQMGDDKVFDIVPT